MRPGRCWSSVFRALIAPSFAEIFNGNCLKNGLLPVVLPEAVVDGMFAELEANPGYNVTVDLVEQTVTAATGESIRFEVDAFRRQCLLNGWDDIALTLRHADRIRAFEEQRMSQMPWLAAVTCAGPGRAMKPARIAILPGDGIGPEVVAEAVRVLKAGAFDWLQFEFLEAPDRWGGARSERRSAAAAHAGRSAIGRCNTVGAVGRPAI